MVSNPAIATLKQYPVDMRKSLLQQVLYDKGVQYSLLSADRNQSLNVANKFRGLVLRQDPNPSKGHYIVVNELDFIAQAFREFNTSNHPYRYSYLGLPAENTLIDNAIKESQTKRSLLRQRAGNGATRMFRNYGAGAILNNDQSAIILGGGAAGILAARTLTMMGFNQNNITIIEKNPKLNGIWRQDNVAGLSKNNPFLISFGSGQDLEFAVTPAPGSGNTIPRFLDKVSRQRRPNIIQGKVIRVQPSDKFNHIVTYESPAGDEFVLVAPIVVNCLGNGKPLEPERLGYMKPHGPAGIRWQQKLTEVQAKLLHDKTVVLIGLGNSTAEMMVQFERWRAKGIRINYHVLTHYPRRAVDRPDETFVDVYSKAWRVFRDITVPQLTKFEGDIFEVRAAYYHALAERRIHCDVIEYLNNPGTKRMSIKRRGDLAFSDSVACDQLYTLIGYGHDPKDLETWGLLVDDRYLGTTLYDYDGEFQKEPTFPGRVRVWPGYFGMGAILRRPENANAVVIPGIMHRLYDFGFMAMIRGIEAQRRA